MDDGNNKFGGKEGKDYLRPGPFWRRHLWQIIAAALVVLLLIFAYNTFSLPHPKPAVVVCQSSSTGSWRGWSLKSGWKQLNNMLLNDGTNGGYNGRPTLVAPASCQPKTMDYAVEARIQVVNLGDNYSGFGINVRGVRSSPTETGYSIYIDATSGAEIAVVQGDVLKSAPFTPGTNFHVYRAEVKGNTITFLIDGTAVASVVDNRFISAGEVGLWCANAQIEMSSFKIVAL